MRSNRQGAEGQWHKHLRKKIVAGTMHQRGGLGDGPWSVTGPADDLRTYRLKGAAVQLGLDGAA